MTINVMHRMRASLGTTLVIATRDPQVAPLARQCRQLRGGVLTRV